ncbi:MAG: hypothetical protein IKF36_04200 [Bacilli bacterium]|nr:hypothetical protein [Bacilli bacterium]
MDELLKQVSNIIKESNIPDDIKPIVEAVARGYMRETEGKLPLEGIYNLCNTEFVKKDEDDKDFRTENNYFAMTTTDYDDKCNIFHKVEYIISSNYIKLITILTHELGHVMTEYKPCSIGEDGFYPVAKRTNAVYLKCRYNEEGKLEANYFFGFRMSDGFLESICSKIFESKEFREELLLAGYDLKDYIYKDERLFPSRVYDEYRACFELFDYIMDGKLFDFSIKKYDSNKELSTFVNENNLIRILGYLDKSNEALWSLKRYEGKEADEEYKQLLSKYKELKKVALELAPVLMESYGKDLDDPKYKELLEVYANAFKKQKTLPVSSNELK